MSCPSLSAMTVHLVAALIAAALVALQPVAVHGAAAAAAASGPRIGRPLTPTKPAAAAAATGTATDGDGDHACSFFLWDVPSLIKYKLCEHLLRRNVYEAKGGKKMVRIRPGSPLGWLYPLSRHAPDRCALCGHAFEDHLRRWWEEKGQVGTAFDRVLDKTHNEGVSVVYLDGAAASGSNDAKRPHPVLRIDDAHVRRGVGVAGTKVDAEAVAVAVAIGIAIGVAIGVALSSLFVSSKI